MTTLYIGVDISKETIDVAYWTGSEAKNIGTYANSETGFAEVAPYLTKLAGTQRVCLVMEATGSYHLSLSAFARQQDWDVALPNPKRVKDWAKGINIRALVETHFFYI